MCWIEINDDVDEDCWLVWEVIRNVIEDVVTKLEDGDGDVDVSFCGFEFDEEGNGECTFGWAWVAYKFEGNTVRAPLVLSILGQ